MVMAPNLELPSGMYLMLVSMLEDHIGRADRLT